ncbi:type I restriction enzyme HsdR N-terminal domain-containing protein [Dinghuibacter silviterrae]|uniref:Type I restriction and modification enzyme subunit R-like protein n=1 Tax=Dinghuibacter silviterrae TaxID=1539049 RepID=A0A4R8DEU1_9BACT|nr:type I restriction enzyme HsdR N-terminal domain-containing protein [Dinghuibacter silviterrae]TDW95788.1 type I restriction and modification enzyme subunit R-like protein [Dinghuibacter silviterrae]
MIHITYPDYAHAIREEDGAPVILDPVRRKWVRLTPEEWVRQNFLQYLLQVQGYPSSLVSVEKEILVGERRKRYDIVVFDRDTRPWLLVECKETSVALGPDTLEQALRYHIQVPVRYIAITNGHYTYAWEKREGRLSEMTALPSWE